MGVLHPFQASVAREPGPLGPTLRQQAQAETRQLPGGIAVTRRCAARPGSELSADALRKILDDPYVVRQRALWWWPWAGLLGLACLVVAFGASVVAGGASVGWVWVVAGLLIAGPVTALAVTGAGDRIELHRDHLVQFTMGRRLELDFDDVRTFGVARISGGTAIRDVVVARLREGVSVDWPDPIGRPGHATLLLQCELEPSELALVLRQRLRTYCRRAPSARPLRNAA